MDLKFSFFIVFTIDVLTNTSACMLLNTKSLTITIKFKIFQPLNCHFLFGFKWHRSCMPMAKLYKHGNNEQNINLWLTMFQGRKQTGITEANKKEWKIILVHEGTNRALNFEKRHFRASIRQKNSWVTLPKCVILSFSDKVNFPWVF